VAVVYSDEFYAGPAGGFYIQAHVADVAGSERAELMGI